MPFQFVFLDILDILCFLDYWFLERSRTNVVVKPARLCGVVSEVGDGRCVGIRLTSHLRVVMVLALTSV